MFVRRKKNRSGTTSIVVVDKSSGKFTELATIGVASVETEIPGLISKGKEWISRYCGQQTIDFEMKDEGLKQREADMTDHVLSNIVKTSLHCPQIIIGKVYDKIRTKNFVISSCQGYVLR